MGPSATFPGREQTQGWRLWLAMFVIAAAALASLVRALQEPSTGWRFSADSQGGVVATPVREALPRLTGVSALSSTGASGPASVALAPMHVIESAGIHNEFSVHNRFFEDHRRIWDVLHGEAVTVHHAGGHVVAEIRPRALDELGPRFWFPWAVGLLSLSVGLALWVYRPRDLAARCFLVSSAGYAFGMLCTADWGSRLLTQPPQGWAALHVASHAGTFAVGGALCILLWNQPNRLGGRWLPWAVVGVSGFSVLAEAFQWVSTISQAFRLPVVLVNALLFTLYYLQWRASRNDPAQRAQLKWFGLLLLMGLSTVFVAYAVGATGRVVNIPQNYGLASVALLFLGLVPLVTRVGLFQLEAWWPRAWLWFVGGLLVLALDLVLLMLLDLSAESALGIALALAGWLYFPLRQVVWRRLSHGALPATRDVLPLVLELVTRGADDERAVQRWHALWDALFQPARVLAADAALDSGIQDDGRRLVVRAGRLPALLLELPGRGTRLFSPADARRAHEISQLTEQGLAAHDAREQGAQAERLRIASDLHDDLGARLLSIAHSSESPRVAELAREALNDMRLAVRGLTLGAVDLDAAMARWRAECVGRLSEAGVQVDWQGGEPPLRRISARLDTTLTRALREATNNILRHSRARHCAVRFDWDTDTLRLHIANDGLADAAPGTAHPAPPSTPPAAHAPPAAGRGLAFMATRIQRLGGQLRTAVTHAGPPCFTVDIQVPLNPPDAPAPGQPSSPASRVAPLMLLAAAACLWAALLPAPALASTPGPADPATAARVQRLDQAQAAWSARTVPPAQWTDRVQLPDDWSTVGAGFSGQRWYRLRFDDPGLDLPAVYIDRVCTNAEVWVNGVLVGSGGRMSEPYSRNCYYPQLYNIPRRLLQPRDNLLDIRVAGYPLQQVAARQRVGALAGVSIGPEPELHHRFDRQMFWNITVAQIIGASMALFGVFMLALALARPQDRYFLYFGALQIGWAVLGTRLYVQDIPLGGLASEIVITSLFPPVVGMAVQFLLHYVRQPRAWVAAALLVQALAVPLVLWASAPRHFFSVASAVYTLLAIEFVLALLFFGVHTWRHMRRDFYLVGSVVLVAAALALAEIAIQNDWLPLPRVHLIHFVMPFVFFAIGLRLVRQFAAALSRTEQLNAQLEQRVAEKSAEIERNYAQMAELRASQAAQRERQRIAGDLHDDLGARLLSIVHAGSQGGPSTRVADLARDALDDMRLSVRGLTASSAQAADVLADWRSESIGRLREAGIDAHWQASEPPDGLLLPARTQVQLTRVLREAVSNAIRHSACTRCDIRVTLQPGWLALSVQDNGRGLPPGGPPTAGLGLPGIERRARQLGGRMRLHTPAGGGLALQVDVPLDSGPHGGPQQGSHRQEAARDDNEPRPPTHA